MTSDVSLLFSQIRGTKEVSHFNPVHIPSKLIVSILSCPRVRGAAVMKHLQQWTPDSPAYMQSVLTLQFSLPCFIQESPATLKFPADTGFLCDKARMLNDTIKWTPCTSKKPSYFIILHWMISPLHTFQPKYFDNMHYQSCTTLHLHS